MDYYLKHKDVTVASVNFTGNTLIINKEHLPVGVKDKTQLLNWIKNRHIPKSRANGIDPMKYMLDNRGISLSDSYWFSISLDESWNEVVHSGRYSPDATLLGDMPKKWVNRQLIKWETPHQSFCEVLASEIHRQQGVQYVNYTLIEVQDTIGCECACFVDENTDLVPAIDIMWNEKIPNDKSIYEFYLAKCLKNGLDLRQDLEYQIMTDFIISNTDRHMNNFGIIRDSKTLKWLHMAPIFDSGNSMFYNSMSIPVGNELLKIKVNSFASKETKLLSYVQNRGLVDTSKLPSGDWVYNLLQKDELIKEETNERLVRAYLQKIKYLEDFQNGADLASYNYVKSMNLFV